MEAEMKRIQEIKHRLLEEERERQKQEILRIQEMIEEEERVNLRKLTEKEVEEEMERRDRHLNNIYDVEESEEEFESSEECSEEEVHEQTDNDDDDEEELEEEQFEHDDEEESEDEQEEEETGEDLSKQQYLEELESAHINDQTLTDNLLYMMNAGYFNFRVNYNLLVRNDNDLVIAINKLCNNMVTDSMFDIQ